MFNILRVLLCIGIVFVVYYHRYVTGQMKELDNQNKWLDGLLKQIRQALEEKGKEDKEYAESIKARLQAATPKNT